jgi:hypothetical protein
LPDQAEDATALGGGVVTESVWKQIWERGREQTTNVDPVTNDNPKNLSSQAPHVGVNAIAPCWRQPNGRTRRRILWEANHLEVETWRAPMFAECQLVEKLDVM